jgi:ATP-dependent protease ClpP protease subunit
MSPEEAKDFGLIDQVMTHRPSPDEAAKAKS